MLIPHECGGLHARCGWVLSSRAVEGRTLPERGCGPVRFRLLNAFETKKRVNALSLFCTWHLAFQREGCSVRVLYLILKFLEDLAGSGGSDPA
jgi:hypothetical protein